jgi:polysaccharide deacetylase 2 family uncharacterized protein YibQ
MVGLSARTTNLIIDASTGGPAIAKALKELEEEARRTGMAIGTGTGLEITIEEVADWAKSLNDRGILLVPLSTAYRGRTG